MRAGFPRLIASRVPDRHSVDDQDRVAAGPVEFAGPVLEEAAQAPAAASMLLRSRAAALRGPSIDETAAAVDIAATGQEMGELFEYELTAPASVERGQSAMIPILSERFEPVKDYLGVRDEIAKLEQSVEELTQDREQLYKRQEQIQKSMTALGKDGEEGRLRGRYVMQLEQSEDRLAEIVKAIEGIRQEIQRKQAQADQMVAALG